jgi:hypothetical protein
MALPLLVNPLNLEAAVPGEMFARGKNQLGRVSLLRRRAAVTTPAMPGI